MIKLIAADMDGTLLSPDGTISSENTKAIKAFQKSGGIFVVCTGRDYDMSKEPLKKAEILCDFICASGALIYNKNGQIMTENLIPTTICKEVVSIFESHQSYVELFTNKGRVSTVSIESANRYFKEEWPRTQVLGKIITTYDEADRLARQIIEQTTFLTSRKEMDALKIYKICTAMEDLETLDSLKSACKCLNLLSVESSFVYNAEITQKGINKGQAVSKFADIHGITLDEIMVLGDSDNDKSMMEMDFSYTVAMENATDEIKELAKYSTSSNDKDGVAHAIYKFAI